MNSLQRSAIGGVIWFALTLWLGPNLFANDWAHSLVLLSALVISPLALDVIVVAPIRSRPWWWHDLAALSLAASYALPAGLLEALCALPWAAYTVCRAIDGLGAVKTLGLGGAFDRLCGAISLAYLGVGGLWVLADRFGVRPLGFDGEIVALTAVHFHYAGLLLPMAAGLVWRHVGQTRLASRAVVGVVLGVPAVAIGITATQLGWGQGVECAAGWFLALSGMIVAILHVRLATEAGAPGAVRALWGIAGVSLFFGMVLAACYAMRSFGAPLPWLGLAWMRALHGTLNAVGFGLCAVLAWSMEAQSSERR